jgi:hypothetical protein
MEGRQTIEIQMTFDNNFFSILKNNTALKRVMLHSIEGIAADQC